MVRPLFRCGSWLCGNAEAGSLSGLGCSATELREVCVQYFSEFVYNAT